MKSLGFRKHSTRNKASGGERIPAELFQILKDDAVKERLLDTQTIIHYSETGPKVRQKKARSSYVMSVPFPTDKATRGSGLAEVAQADKFSLTNLDKLS